jgi:methyltransferase
VLIRLAVCGFAIVCRLAELGFSRRNIEGYVEGHEGNWSRRSYPAVVLLHAGVLGGTLLTGGRPLWAFLVAFLAVQPLRAWVLLTLGNRWNTRGVVPSGMQPETRGPYAFIRHPNYTVVAIELFSLPAAFGLIRLAAAATALNAGLMWLRIRDEEALLQKLPGYQEHFGGRKRFIPGIF